ncbi:jg15359, partial [Pararge aegeria aegeria]
EFLEDINNMLNSGEVPNLFEGDSYEQVQTGCRSEAAKAGVNPGDRDAVYYYFINRVRGKLHLCICMSPVGEAFRRRCRMFPSLVNCCTIDWFTKWPPEALLSVAQQCLQPLEKPDIIEKISALAVSMHQRSLSENHVLLILNQLDKSLYIFDTFNLSVYNSNNASEHERQTKPDQTAPFLNVYV